MHFSLVGPDLSERGEAAAWSATEPVNDTLTTHKVKTPTTFNKGQRPVSYTHLTLPTIYSV